LSIVGRKVIDGIHLLKGFIFTTGRNAVLCGEVAAVVSCYIVEVWKFGVPR